MDGEDENQEFSDADAARIAALTTDETRTIDAALVGASRDRWSKCAMVIVKAMSSLRGEVPNLPDLFYARRLRGLVDLGVLEARGNLGDIRASEVRLKS